MIVVTVELHSAVTGETSQIGEVKIVNDGTGTHEVGNDDVTAWLPGDTIARGKVVGFHRLSHDVYDLLRYAIEALPKTKYSQQK